MDITLTECKANTRGKATRPITYKGIGKLKVDQVPSKDDNGKSIKGTDGKVVTEPKESLDTSEAENTLTIKDIFSQLAKGEEKPMVRWLIDGYNAEALRLASDQLAQYVDSSWSNEVTASFRLIVNNMLKLPGNPGIEKAVEVAKSFIGK